MGEIDLWKFIGEIYAQQELRKQQEKNQQINKRSYWRGREL